MKKKIDMTLIISTLACLLPILFSLAVYDRLPDQVATHFNFSGEADGYSPKAFAVIGLPAFMAVFNLIVQAALKFDPKHQNHPSALITVVKWLFPVLSIVMVGATTLNALGWEVSMDKLVYILVGVVMIIIGNYLPKCKQNYTMGIKLPWTLDDEDNWNRTHRLGGWIYVLCGIVFMVGGLLGIGWPMFVVFFVLALVPMVYSFLLYKKKQKNQQ